MKLVNKDFVKDWEGLRLSAYMPTVQDRPTIGWGHTKGVKMGMTITLEQAEQYFLEDVEWADAAVEKYIKVKFNQHQHDALVSFIFNVGEENFRTSTLRRKMNAGDIEGAANEFPRWNKQKGRVLKGLTRRRAAEQELFVTPMPKFDLIKWLIELLSGKVK